MHSLELWRNFICGNETGSPGRAVSLHLARSGSQSEHRIRRILPARGACHIIMDIIDCQKSGFRQKSVVLVLVKIKQFIKIMRTYVVGMVQHVTSDPGSDATRIWG